MRRWFRRFFCLLVLILGATIATWPMVPEGIPLHSLTDLANHVRNTDEYRLALEEGQLPPTVSPALNSGTRIPLFQHYGGTAYTLPGLIGWIGGVSPYRALGAGIFVHVLLGGIFTYLSARTLGARPSVALLAGVAFQTFPFLGPDLYVRGGYPQVLAFWAFPLVLYPMLRLVVKPVELLTPPSLEANRRSIWRFTCLAALAWAYFIPIHPLQTVMLGAMTMGIFGVHALLDRRGTGIRGVFAMAISLIGGAAATAWFWYPVARNRKELQVSAHAAFLDAGLADPWILLSPWYQKTPAFDWAPQFGILFVLGALLSLVFLWRTRFAGVLAALAVAAIVAVVLYPTAVPEIGKLLAPLQWSYRLLIPAAMAGVLCIALGVEALCAVSRNLAVEGAVTGAGIAYALTLAPLYYVADVKIPRYPQDAVLTPGFYEGNAYQYALRGTDLQSLGWMDGDRVLKTGIDIAVPREGYPLDVRLTLRPIDANAAAATLTAKLSGGQVLPPTSFASTGDPAILAFRLTPSVGLVERDKSIRFETSSDAAKWRVEDLTVRVEGDPAGTVFRVPQTMKVQQRRRRVQITVDIPPGGDGLYQLPVCYLPTNRVTINDKPADHASADRFMTIVPLKAGQNIVKIHTRPHIPASVFSGLALIAIVVGFVKPPPWRKRKPETENAPESSPEASSAAS